MRNKRTNFRAKCPRRPAGSESVITPDAAGIADLPSRVERRAARFRPGLYREIMADQDANRAYLNISSTRRGA
jgi:hypothetical protein